MLENRQKPSKKGILWSNYRPFYSGLVILALIIFACKPSPKNPPILYFNIKSGQLCSSDTITRINIVINKLQNSGKIKLLEIRCNSEKGISNMNLPLFSSDKIEELNYCKIFFYDITLNKIFKERQGAIDLFIYYNKRNDLLTYTTDTMLNLEEHLADSILILSPKVWW